MLGLPSDLPRKNFRTIAELSEESSPTGCSTYLPGPGGMLMASVMTFGATWQGGCRICRSWSRPFRLLMAGQLVSLLGDGMANVALIYAVLRESPSATSLGLVLAAQWLPLVAFSLFGGVLSDRCRACRR